MREKEQLDELVHDYGVYINHGYYIRNGKYDGTCINHNGKIEINPYFDQILEYMSELRDSEDLYITTIRKILDYWILTENVSFNYLTNGKIIVTNNNDKPIMGLSLAVRSSKVLVNGITPKSRKAGNDTIIWFNIRAGETLVLTFD